jgi:transcription elongation factor Elf1
MQELFEEHDELLGSKAKKRGRRLDEEIDKTFNCPYERCYRQYGSDISLNNHIKIKHNGGNKTDREKAAVIYC